MKGLEEAPPPSMFKWAAAVPGFTLNPVPSSLSSKKGARGPLPRQAKTAFRRALLRESAEASSGRFGP